MNIKLTEKEVKRLQSLLPDIRPKNKGNGMYKIRGATDEQVKSILTNNLFEIKGYIEPNVVPYVKKIKIEEPKKEIVMSEPVKMGGFAGYMAQGAEALEKQLDEIAVNFEKKANITQQKMDNIAKKMEEDAILKVDGLGKKVDDNIGLMKKEFMDFSASVTKSISDLNNMVLLVVKQSKDARKRVADALVSEDK